MLKGNCINRFAIISFIILCVTDIPVSAQKIKLNTFLDTTSILIGDQLHYTIEIEQPKKISVSFPSIKDSLTSKIEIVKSEPTDTLVRGDNWLIRKKYLITSFDSGSYTIPAFKFAFKFENVNDTISSSQLVLKVNTLPVDTAKEIIDIKPTMNTPFSFSEIKWELLTGFVILLIIGLAIWIFMRFRKNKPLFSPKKPQEPPHITALRELDLLRSEKLWQGNQIKLYHTRITDILRQYITGRYGIYAMELTSDEILHALSSELNTDMELKMSFSKLLSLADLVKFAKAEPLPDENEISLLSAYTFVNRTKIELSNTNTDNNKELNNQE